MQTARPKLSLCITLATFVVLCTALNLLAQATAGCESLPDHDKFRAVLQSVVKEGKQKNGGLGNQMWGAVVNRDGIVCAVVFTGPQRGDQWPGSRLIAAEKANTTNAFSLDNFALSTANVYWPSQPGQSLYGFITIAPPNPNAVFGDPAAFGQKNDPMVGKAIGGVVVFAGGLPLYNNGKLIGGLGVSGDTSCTDHVIGWKTRHELKLDSVPLGVSPSHDDNMIQDIQNGQSASGFGHPTCKGGMPSNQIIQQLSKQFPTGPRK